MSSHYLSGPEASALSGMGVGVIDGILKLAAHGLKAPAIHAYAADIANGKEPAILPVTHGPRPVHIQLHSFLADPRQYGDTYHLPESLVTDLRALELSDPERAREEVLKAVSSSARIVQSGRPVRVILDGSPGSPPSTATPLANASGVTKSLSAEVASDPMRYGAYKFEAEETTLGLTQRFAVDLGQNFYAVTFSKKNAVSVARIASVLGRGNEAVEPYITYVNSAGQMLHGRDIPESYWDCRRGPRDDFAGSERKLGVSIAKASQSPGSGARTTVG
nr:proline-alanine-serine-rich protein [Ustilaginoidea virens polymycovirus 1]